MHASLYVSDIQKTVQFYSAFFKQEPSKVKPGYAKFTLDKPSLIISFVEKPERVKSNFGHLGFQLETLEELNESLNVSRELGQVTLEEIGTQCCYAKQDKYWVTDPDGIQWEVYYFHEDVEFNDPHYDLKAKEACCGNADAELPKEACCGPENETEKKGVTCC